MPDASYQPGVYRERSGDRFVVAASGEIDVEPGGKFQVNGTDFITTGSKIDLSSAGSLVSSGFYAGSGVIDAQVGYKQYVQYATSSAATLTAYGISHLITSTAVTMPLAAPTAGVEKWISIIAAGTSGEVSITSSSAGADFTTAGSTQITVSTGTLIKPQWVHLLGLNSTRWTVLGQSTDAVVS